MELFAGTEPSIIGTETWTRNGMYFFPDTCFYEFITEKDMLHNYEDPTFTPPTYLMDEVVPGEKYELVITVLKGGAFARYRVGDPLTSTFEPYIPCMLFCIAMDAVASAVTMAFCSMTVSSLIKSFLSALFPFPIV